MPPLLIPTVALVCGVLLAEIGAGVIWSISSIGLAIIVYLYLLYASKKPSIALRINKYHYCWIAILFLGIGIAVSFFSQPEDLPEGENVIIKGQVIQREALNSGDRLQITPEKIIYESGEEIDNPNTKILLYSSPSLASPGDLIEAYGSLRAIQDSPDKISRDFRESMRHQGITTSMRTNTETPIFVIGHKNNIITQIRKIRENLSIFIDHTSISGASKMFLKATLLGDRDGMKEVERSRFADAGIAHILALSGLHVGIIVMIIMWLLLPLSLYGFYRFRYLMVIILIWAYAVLTGLSPSIVRASVMTTCLMGGLLLERQRSGLNALCLAVFILTIADPGSIYNAGMQLSVGCVLCLLLFTESLNPIGHRKHPNLYKLVSALLATMVATIGTWPLTTWHFSRFPLMFLPVNLLVLPLLPWYVILSLLYFLFFAIGVDFVFLSKLLDLAYNGLEQLAEFARAGVSVITINTGIITCILWAIGLILLGIGFNTQRKSKRLMIWSGTWIMLITLVTIPLFKQQQPDGFIIGRGADKYMLTFYNEGEEFETLASPGELTLCESLGRKIAIIDTDLNFKRLDDQALNPDIAVVGKNCWNSLDEIVESLQPKLILIHPSIMTKREQRLIENHSSGTPVYSLRKQGAYREISFRK